MPSAISEDHHHLYGASRKEKLWMKSEEVVQVMGIRPTLEVEEENENAAAAAAPAAAEEASYESSNCPKPIVACDCPNRCQPFQFLPMHQGIMITLHRQQQQQQQQHHHRVDMDNAAGNTTVNRSHAASNEINDDATIPNNALLRSSSTSDHHPPTTTTTTTTTTSTTTSTTCPRLEIYPQKDANLIQFHPNIYIPEVLLEYPDHLIKYGGGGKKT
jgi:hypothetical protein